MELFPAALKNNHGQSLIESLALSAALMAALTVLCGVLYFGFVHVGANYLLHELLVCEATQGENRCEQTFRQKAQSFLFAAKIQSLESRRSFDKLRGRLVLQMPMKRTLTIKKELTL